MTRKIHVGGSTINLQVKGELHDLIGCVWDIFLSTEALVTSEIEPHFHEKPKTFHALFSRAFCLLHKAYNNINTTNQCLLKNSASKYKSILANIAKTKGFGKITLINNTQHVNVNINKLDEEFSFDTLPAILK